MMADMQDNVYVYVHAWRYIGKYIDSFISATSLYTCMCHKVNDMSVMSSLVILGRKTLHYSNLILS